MIEQVGGGWRPIVDVFCELVAWDNLYNNMPKVEITSLVDKHNNFKLEFTGGNEITVAYARMANKIASLQDEDDGIWSN